MSASRSTTAGEASPLPGSYVDPAGAVYDRDGRIVRGIRDEFAPFYAALLERAVVRRLLGRAVVETEVASPGLPGYPLTLEHRRIAPVSYCYEWPAAMLQDAALLTLDIGVQLLKDGLSLQDAYPWNVVFDGPRPLLVDFTSIVPQDPDLLWVAYDQFCSFFLYPLVMASMGAGRIARALLRDHIAGVPVEEFVRWFPARGVLRAPWLLGRVLLPFWTLSLLRRWGQQDRIVKMAGRLRPSGAARAAFLRSLRARVASLPIGHTASGWTNYYADMQTFNRPEEFSEKQSRVARILGECRPKTLMDLGCNRGGYAILAARSGARVTACDADEASVGFLYQLARERGLAILPLVLDVLNPSPACGWRGVQFAGATQRLRSEMALALALVHHLAITQRQTFERIVPTLADYAEKWLLVEYVPLEDLHSRELMATLRRDMRWYTLDRFRDALGTAFRTIQTYPSHPPGRVLLLCTK